VNSQTSKRCATVEEVELYFDRIVTIYRERIMPIDPDFPRLNTLVFAVESLTKEINKGIPTDFDEYDASRPFYMEVQRLNDMWEK
jgi:hypothetical protein